MKKYYSNSRSETVRIGEELGRTLTRGDTVAFRGGLGAGKTALTTGIALGLGIKAEVCSPTFAIVNEYRGEHFNLYHFDMYRIANEEGLESTGFFDYDFSDNIAVVEWSENITEFLPENTIFVTINVLGENEREIIIEGGGKNAAAWN